MKIIKEITGEELKLMRIESCMTRKDLSELLNITESAIFKLETGLIKIKGTTVIAIMSVFNEELSKNQRV